MDLPAPLGSHLDDLITSIGTDGGPLTSSLTVMTADLRAAVPSYLGLRLTLVVDGWPITLTAFADVPGERSATSLRLHLSGPGGGFDLGSQVVLYASRPGAFVDLAADIEYLDRWSRPPRREDGGPPPVALDVELPPATLVSGFTGLTEHATISRAVGMLIERGHDPVDASAALHRDARACGLDVDRYAARLLEP